MKPIHTLRPGERLFALILVMFSSCALWESYGISGFSGLTTGGAMPMLASTIMVLTGLVILSASFRRTNSTESGVAALITYLFSVRIVLFTCLVATYVAVIPSIGFLGASGGLLFVTIWALWRKGPLPALLIALLSIAAIYFLFRIVFQVVLPIGSLWQ